MTEQGPARRTFDSIPADGITRLMSKRIYFGHQSVGQNIIQGLQELLAAHGLSGFNLTETAKADPSRTPVFLHSGLGANGDPTGKIAMFESIMNAGMGNTVDIAFMKLCYADIGPQTDVAAVFNAYTQTVSRLKARYPKTLFIHLTDPLTVRESGLKTAVKSLLGRQLNGYRDNAARERLNTLLRAEFGGKGLFDLALHESTRPDGLRAGYAGSGARYYALEGVYTDDGGHLNGKGREYIATELLAFLVDEAR